MKKLLLLFIGSAVGLSAFAQKTGSNKYADSNLYRLVLDVNLTGGTLMQSITKSDVNALNSPTLTDIGSMKFSKGMSYGFDGQLGLFVGKKRHWGFGAGLAYFMQQGDMTLDKYNVTYKATDAQGRSYTQSVTATGPIVEKLKITNMNIPVFLKYKKRFNKTWGFTADAGILYNLQYKNAFTTNATFDYKATGQTSAYNVGLGVSPTKKDGDYTYTTGSIGYFAQPSVNLFLSNVCALNFGLYYMYQPVKNTNGNTNQLTSLKGDYTSMLKSVATSNNQSIGANIGVRFFIGKLKDSDHDGTPDIKDHCPTIPGPGELFGCPDFDHDGIPDREDSCAREPGPYKFHGCPDNDGDGVPDREDACPTVPGSVELHGCPDRDGDGVADKDDACPDVKGLAKYHGCPDTDGDGIADNEDRCPTEIGPESNNGCPVVVAPPPPPAHIDITTPILFEVNKTDISSESYPVLEEAIRELNEDKTVVIYIDGYTDNSGSEVYNKVLSVKRANEVKKYLVNKGASAKRLKIAGHGPKDPIAENETPEGRAKNRRVIMHVKGK